MNLLMLSKSSFLNNNKIFLSLFLLCFTSRSIVAFFYGDRFLENEWAILVKNLYLYNSFSLINFGDLFLPNLWMPPIYGYFVYLHALIFGLNENLATYVNMTQIIISSFTPIIFYKLISNFFSKDLSIIGSFVFGLFPLIVYSASQISSVTIYLFLLLSFIYLIINLNNNKLLKYFFLTGFLAGILVLTRRDFILIFIFSLFYSYFFFKIKFKKIVYILLITLVTLSPYLIRNYVAFDKLIIHSGLGYNIWKAYNTSAEVEGYYEPSNELKIKLEKVDKNINYRINEDKVYLDQALVYLKENPKKYVNLFFKRLFSFYFYDDNSSQKNYYNNFHLVPNIMIAFLSLLGLIICYKKKEIKYYYLILLMMIILVVYAFFALLPRYKIYILPFQIILSLSFIEFLLTKFIKKN